MIYCFRVTFRALKMAMAIPAMEMILPQSSGGNIPAFLAKLWKTSSRNGHNQNCFLFRMNFKNRQNKCNNVQNLIVFETNIK